MTIYRCALCAISLALPIFAQQKGNNPARPPAKTAAQVPASKPEGLTVEDVIALVEAGLSDDVVVARLRKEDKSFDLTTEEMIRLKKAKVGDAVLRVMLDPKAQVGLPVAQGAPAAVQPVVLSAGIPMLGGIQTANASGATPAPGSEAKGDPNDPMTPHDSGIYLMTKDRDGKPQMTVLERASYQGSKTGGYMASAMTYGILKAKTKAVIPGPRANIRVSETSPVFYFYFEDKAVGLGKTYFGVGNLSNPSQFALLKLDATKGNRESTVGQFSALGTSSGTDSKAMIPFKSERVRAGLYKVVIESLRPGEYCFVASSNMGVQSPYGASASVTSDIFDFGVSVE